MTSVVVFVTAPRRAVKKIVDSLLRQRLAACVNIVPSVESHYLWKGKREKAREVFLIMKTTKRLFHPLRKAIRAAHPYEVPEIIALPLVAGHAPYLRWIEAETRSAR